MKRNKHGYFDLARKAEEERNKLNRNQYDGTNEDNKRRRLIDAADPDSFVTQHHESSSGGENKAAQRAYPDSSDSLRNDSFRYNADEMDTPPRQSSHTENSSPDLLSGSSSDNKTQTDGDDVVDDSQEIPLFSEVESETDDEDDSQSSQNGDDHGRPSPSTSKRNEEPDYVKRFMLERVFDK